MRSTELPWAFERFAHFEAEMDDINATLARIERWDLSNARRVLEKAEVEDELNDRVGFIIGAVRAIEEEHQVELM